jgi:NhaA family Na+:H+ antiporter
MTPVIARLSHIQPLEVAATAVTKLSELTNSHVSDVYHFAKPIKILRHANRELLPPVTRIQMAFHPWVAYGVMPLFALANAGVSLKGLDIGAAGAKNVMLGVILALAVGKPLGILMASWLVVRLGWCRLPAGLTWPGVVLVAMLAGIGFTMSIFIATLAFDNTNLLGAAKLGVLVASSFSAVAGLSWGVFLIKRSKVRGLPTSAIFKK